MTNVQSALAATRTPVSHQPAAMNCTGGSMYVYAWQRAVALATAAKKPVFDPRRN